LPSLGHDDAIRKDIARENEHPDSQGTLKSSSRR
jgi:hypothetical protein